MVDVSPGTRPEQAVAGGQPGRGLAAAVMAAVVVIWGLGPPVTKLIAQMRSARKQR